MHISLTQAQKNQLEELVTSPMHSGEDNAKPNLYFNGKKVLAINQFGFEYTVHEDFGRPMEIHETFHSIGKICTGSIMDDEAKHPPYIIIGKICKETQKDKMEFNEENFAKFMSMFSYVI